MSELRREKIRLGVAWDAVSFPFKNILPLIRIGLMPGLLAFALCAAVFHYIWPEMTAGSAPEDHMKLIRAMLPGMFAISAILSAAAVIYAVGIHQFIVQGERPGWILFRVRRYELAYALLVIIFFLVQFSAQYPFLLIEWLSGRLPIEALDPRQLFSPERQLQMEADSPALPLVLLSLVIFGLMIWIYVRLILVFPHAAVTGRISLSESWRAMSGNFWRFVAAAILTGLAMGLVYLLLSGLLIMTAQMVGELLLPSSGGAGQFNPLALAGLIPVGGLLLAMTVALLSYIYRDLIARPRPDIAAG